MIRVNILIESPHNSGCVISGDPAVHKGEVERGETGRVVEIDVGVVETAGGDAIADETDYVAIVKNWLGGFGISGGREKRKKDVN
jgi:hypothetical protein